MKNKKRFKGFTKEEIESIQEKYTEGTKIRAIKTFEDIVPNGTIGIVRYVDDIGKIHLKWDNDSSYGLVEGVDEFEII